MNKPIIGITMGDPAGIGPEIIAKSFTHKSIFSRCRPFVIGDRGVIKDAIRLAGASLQVSPVEDPAAADFWFGNIGILDMRNFNLSPVPYGKVHWECGKAAGDYIEKAVHMAMGQKIDAVVTAPINKEAFDLGGYGKKYRGHTEMLGSLTGADGAFMVLASGKLRVIHVTTHVSMKDAVKLITLQRVYETIVRGVDACGELGIGSPKIGVAAFNAHGGDGGIMGREEIEAITPAIKKAREGGIDVEGPVPGDTIFPRGIAGTYDMVVAMYHDQGHIPVKMLGFNWDGSGWSSVRGVNITVGLPIIRTSVDHGTAFGKAGKGTADESSLLDAIDYAIVIADNRRRIKDTKNADG